MECNPENIYQVSLNSDHDDMRGKEGKRRGKLQRRLNISSSSTTTSSMVGRSVGS